MNINEFFYSDDCTLYFILNDESKRKFLKLRAQAAISKKLSEDMGLSFNHMVSGPDIRRGMSLKKDFQQMRPEQVAIVYINVEEEMVTMISPRQRDMFFDEILALEEDADTLPIVQKFIDEIAEKEEGEQQCTTGHL